MLAPNPTRTPQDLGGEHVSFTTSDGVLLRGHLHSNGSTGVILAHMYPADPSGWTDFAQVLAAHGYQALTGTARLIPRGRCETGCSWYIPRPTQRVWSSSPPQKP
jgi:hypothetical protein